MKKNKGNPEAVCYPLLNILINIYKLKLLVQLYTLLALIEQDGRFLMLHKVTSRGLLGMEVQEAMAIFTVN
ncbi:hypothetical protein [Paenibacillus sp. FSL M7-1046]|uniref:hypothetical protein n=1 Tax=Paenibacillus sp. FSL M7-1046 TaxID=2975315 RepID=UPI0030FB9F82